MESCNLATASTYVNSLLLARGLLSDNKRIEFAHPSRGDGGKEGTMGQIMKLVHDLIVKRDDEQAHRDSMTDTLRSLRAELTRQTMALEKQETGNKELDRQLSLAQAQESSGRKALQAAESSARKLRLEMQRLKCRVEQVRNSCSNEVRKRDKEIQRLKSHLTSQQRGNKTGLVGASITIHPGNTGLGASVHDEREGWAVGNGCCRIQQESSEFLTRLSQGLSEENDKLIGLIRRTVMRLRELQGMSEPQQQEEGEGEGKGRHDNKRPPPPTTCEALTDDMDSVLDHLKTLLTSPHFVGIDEVEMREEEIERLRAGWEKMEGRLQEAYSLMNAWRKRMTDGDAKHLQALPMGLDLVSEVAEEGETDSVAGDEPDVEEAGGDVQRMMKPGPATQAGASPSRSSTHQPAGVDVWATAVEEGESASRWTGQAERDGACGVGGASKKRVSSAAGHGEERWAKREQRLQRQPARAGS